MKCKQKHWLASPMWRSTLKLTAGTMAMIGACPKPTALTAEAPKLATISISKKANKV